MDSRSIAVVVATIAVMAQSPAAQGQAQPSGRWSHQNWPTGHYKVVEGWPKPLPDTRHSHDGWTWGSVGGGNLEAEAVRRARALLESAGSKPETFESQLSDKAPLQHGVQCCGGEVTVLLEPLAVVPSVAVFGVGHVGLELARILARHDLDLHLVDSRADHLSARALASLTDAVAAVHVHEVPVLPELVLAELPAGTRLLVMTHDHAEDIAI